MFETAIELPGCQPEQHLADVGRMWSAFSAVVEQNLNAWLRQSLSPSEITTPSESNRMVGYPYTKAMNSLMTLTWQQRSSLFIEHAESLGAPRDQWVFPTVVLTATNIRSSPIVTISLDTCR